MTLYITPGGRVYDSSIGRFLQRDPLAKPGENPYLYAHNAPPQLVDPTGFFGFRTCCLFARPMVTDATRIRNHNRGTDGIVFTCRCGWLDTGHIRQTMDLVLFFYLQLKASAKAGTRLRGFEERFELNKDVPARDIVAVASSLAYDEGLLHEIKGYTPDKPVFGMWNSAFSPEDLPSNTAGAYLAQSSLATGGPWTGWTVGDLDKADVLRKWGEVMDASLAAALKECVAIPQDKAMRVWDNHVQNKWVTGSLLSLTLQKRNMQFAPWNIACDECKDVKDKSVPAWLKGGIGIERARYTTRVDIAAELGSIENDIERRFGKGHTTP